MCCVTHRGGGLESREPGSTGGSAGAGIVASGLGVVGESQLRGKERKAWLTGHDRAERPGVLAGAPGDRDGQRGRTAGWGHRSPRVQAWEQVRVLQVAWRLQDDISVGEKKGREGVLPGGVAVSRAPWSPHLSLRKNFIGLSRGSGGHHRQGGERTPAGSEGEGRT